MCPWILMGACCSLHQGVSKTDWSSVAQDQEHEPTLFATFQAAPCTAELASIKCARRKPLPWFISGFRQYGLLFIICLTGASFLSLGATLSNMAEGPLDMAQTGWIRFPGLPQPYWV